jgi:soluble lytic murein transglycosylase-like protein
MALTDEELFAIAQQELAAEMPQSQGSVSFSIPPLDGSSTLNQAPQVQPAPQVGMSEDQLMQIAQQELAAEQSAPPQQDLLGPGSRAQRAGRNIIGGVSQLAPFNLGDEILAGGSTLTDAMSRMGEDFDWGDTYDQKLNEVRNYQKSYNQLSPEGGWLPSIAGGIAMPIGGAASKVKGILPKLAAMSAEGGILGAGYGFGSGEGKEDRLNKAGDSAKFGAVAAPTIGATLAALGAMAKPLVKAGKDLGRKSVGASYSDYAKSADDIGATSLSDDAVSKTKANLDDLIASGELGNSRNPAKLKKLVGGKSRDLSTKIDSELRSVEAKGPKIFPQFSRAETLIDEGKIPADQIPRYEKRLSELMGNIVKLGKGKLTYLQQQKIALGKMYDPNDTLANNFNRALYHDLQETIEKAAPAVKPLNRQLEKFKTIEPILQRGAAKYENADLIQKGINLTKTTGGFGVPILLGSSVGGPVGLVVGAAGSAALNPQGQRLLGKALVNSGGKLSKAGKVDPSPISRALTSVFSHPETPNKAPEKIETGTRQPNKPKSKQSLSGEAPSLNNTKTVPTSKELKEARATAELLAPAIAQVESAGNDKAISPKGAMGKMQLMPEIVKAFDVKDPFNAEQSLEGGIKLLTEELQRYRSVPLAVMAYNAGSPAVNKAIKQAGSKDPKQVIRFLPKETRDYLPKVLKALEALT